MKKLTFKLNRNEFVDWMYEDFDTCELMEAWENGETPEEHALSIAGLFPIRYIKNWEEIKHYWDDVPYKGEMDNNNKTFNSWSEYYEDDGHVESIPKDLKVEWIYEEQDNE
jgi:hypothetical protein